MTCSYLLISVESDSRQPTHILLKALGECQLLRGKENTPAFLIAEIRDLRLGERFFTDLKQSLFLLVISISKPDKT